MSVPICFEDGNVAYYKYQVPLRHGGPCPKCHLPIDTLLAYNPFDQNYYLHCGGCGKWFKWCDINGNLLNFAVVTSNKKTEVDENLGLSEFTDTFSRLW